MADREQAQFHDHFSERAPGYAIYRPTYPRELVDYLSDLTIGASAQSSISPGEILIRGTAWEAGCGSGQLTHVLAERFERVIATDASADQIAQARPHPRAEYRVARADASGLPDHAADLAIAAQAAHWFDLDAYYAEVRRVVRPGGFVALVVYGIHVTDDPHIDRIVKHFYGQILGPFWPPQRRFVEEGYQTMPFPFDEISSPRFEMRAEWTLAEMLGYVQTWSAVGALARTKGRAEIDAFREEVSIAWGNSQTKRTIRWPLSMRLGRCF
jgi:SAM-dependent methyltransferase